MNYLKWAAVLSLIGLGIAGNFYYSNYSILLRVGVGLVLGLMSLLIAFQTTTGKKFWQFSQTSIAELRRVVWPTRQETMQVTALVIGIVFVVGMILWVVDILLIKIIAWLTGYGAISS